MAIEPGKTELDVNDLMQLLPHRYPMLMVDKVVDIRPGESAVAVKSITYNEPFFPGHFPERPVFPGVLLVEAMAQGAAAFTAYTEQLDTDGKVVLFMGIDKAKFRKPVFPGDQVRMTVRVTQKRPPVWKFEGVATVDDTTVATASFAAMLADPSF